MLEDYPKPCTAASMEVSEGVVSRLRRDKLRLESQLLEVNNALTALESNPEIAKVLELISRVSRF